MEKIVEQGLLYDFYGELLTEHQKQIYEEAVYQDMSLSEIAEEYGISRQGVHDLIQRCNKLLQSYEDKLHLVQKFTDAKKTLREIDQLAESSKESFEGVKFAQMRPGEAVIDQRRVDTQIIRTHVGHTFQHGLGTAAERAAQPVGLRNLRKLPL